VTALARAAAALVLGAALHSALVFGAALHSAPALAQPTPAEPVRATWRVQAPTVLAVRPPAAAIVGQEGGDEALAHLAMAQQALRRCLGTRQVRHESVEADELTLLDGERSRPLRFGVTDDGLAIVLVEPGRRERVVRSPVGPSALSSLAPQAAWDYWRARRCRQP
jgi:hypothetical protein